MKKESPFITKFIAALAILAASVIVLWFLGRIGSVIVYFAISIAIAYLLNPLVDLLQKHRVPRILSILLIFGVFSGCVVLAGFFLVPIIAAQSRELIDSFPQYAETIKGKMEGYRGYVSYVQKAIDKYSILDKAAANIQSVGKNIVAAVTKSIMGFFSYLPGLVVIPVIVFYLLKDVHALRKGFIGSLPEHWRSDAGRLMDRLNRAIGGFISGQLKLCLVVGVLSWLCMAFIARLPYALIMSFIAGVTEFIPYLGPVLGMIMPLIVAATMGWEKAVMMIVIFAAIQVLENNLLAPRIMSPDIGMHPILVIFILMAGGQAAGLAGMLVALPSAVIIKAFYEHFYLEKHVQDHAAAVSPRRFHR
jgi:predicted PurR-regulated permease PerM